jgi:hypothetical protein
MTPDQIATAALSLALFTVICAVWVMGFRPAFLDSLRVELFALRDELFNLAASGCDGFSFDHPAYGKFRTSINATIRFCHLISALDIILIVYAERWYGRALVTGSSLMQDAIEAAQDMPEVQKTLKRYQTRCAVAVAKYLLKSSPLVCLILFGLVLVHASAAAVSKKRRYEEEAVNAFAVVEKQALPLEDLALAA